MKYSLYIFDLDGTILDTLDDLTDGANHALALSGYPLRSRDEIRSFIGNGIKKLIERAAPDGSTAGERDKLYNDFSDYYRVHCIDKTHPYSGIIEMLTSLRNTGCMTAVVSNKADYAVKILADRFFDGLFDITVGQREGVRTKPAHDSVNEVLKQLAVEREKAVYIGDSNVDIETAKNACLPEIAVDWGFCSRDFLSQNGAVDIVSSPAEIIEKY